jgi:hypothetical protein
MSTRVFSPSGPVFSSFGKEISLSLSKSLETNQAYRQPIDYDCSFYGSIMRYNSLQRPYYENLWRIDLGNSILTSEIRRFAVKLEAYLQSPNPLLSAKQIWHYAALGPDGAKILKKIKAKSVWKTFDTTPWVEDPMLRDYPAYEFEDIGQIFNYQYLPFFREKDPEDYKWSFIPVEQKEWALNMFRDTFRKILPDSISNIRKEEILLENRGSSSYVPSEGKQTVPYFKAKEKQNYMGKTIGECLRCIIPKCPGDTRDAVILQLPSSNKVAWIDRQLMEMLSEMSMHIHLRSNKEIHRRISKVGRKYSYFVHRDLKKEGLTKPRNLIKIMLEELNRKFPDCDAFKDTSFYDDFSMIIDHKKVDTKRGHGLGMANCLTTLMNITIYIMSHNVDRDDFTPIQGKATSLSLNDDFVAAFESEDDSWAYVDREEYVMKSLSLIAQPDKSFVSHGKFVIAEEYWPRSLSKKDSFKRGEVLSAFSCVNIAHAKDLVNSYISVDTIDYWESYKEKIVSFWGYEFFPQEYSYPYSFGGWVSNNLLGCSLDLFKIEELPFNSKVLKAYEAVKNVTPPRVRGKRTKTFYNSPYVKVLGNLCVKDFLESRLDIGTLDEISSKYTCFRNCPEKALKAWQGYQNARIKAYRSASSTLTTYNEVVKDYVLNSGIDVIPTESMTESWVSWDVIKGKRDKDPYISLNPLISALVVENQHLRPLEIGEYYSILRKNSSPHLNFSNEDWQKLSNEKLLSSFNMSIDWTPEWVIPDFKEQNLFVESFIDPINVCNVYALIGYKKLPIPKGFFREKEVIKERFKVYNFNIPTKWYPFIQDLEREDIYKLAKLIRENKISEEEAYELLVERSEASYKEKIDAKRKENKPPEGTEEQEVDEEMHPNIVNYLSESRGEAIWRDWVSEKLNFTLSKSYGNSSQRAATSSSEWRDEEQIKRLSLKYQWSMTDQAILVAKLAQVRAEQQLQEEEEADANAFAASLWDE